MPDFTPTPDKCEKAFRKYIEAQNEEALAGFTISPSITHSDFPVPGVVFAVAAEDKIKERKMPRGVFDMPLDIFVGSDAEADKEGVIQAAAAGIIIAHLNDKRAVRLALNHPASPVVDDREVKDFHVFDYFLRSQPTKAIKEGRWETVIELLVVCQGMDAA